MSLLFSDTFTGFTGTLAAYDVDWKTGSTTFFWNVESGMAAAADGVTSSACYQGAEVSNGGAYQVSISAIDNGGFNQAWNGPGVLIPSGTTQTRTHAGYYMGMVGLSLYLYRYDEGTPTTLDTLTHNSPGGTAQFNLGAEILASSVRLEYWINEEPSATYEDSSASRGSNGYPGFIGYADVSANGEPAQIFSFDVYSFVGIVYQYSYPVQDITTGSWSSTGATLYGVVDEPTTFNDADYISTTTYGAECELKLGSMGDPNIHTSHMLDIRVPSAGNAGGGPLTVTLRQGTGTTIKSQTYAGPTAGQTLTMSLTEAEAANITDYTDLRVRIRAGT